MRTVGSCPVYGERGWGPIYRDEDFVGLYPTRGRGAQEPWRLGLVTVFQAIEGLTDRQAAEYMHTRIDWR